MEGTKVTLDNFTCTVPLGWHQVTHPNIVFSAVPAYNDGRLFGITTEPAAACPIPCEIDDESDYEKSYWAKFDTNFETHGHLHIASRRFALVNGLPYRIIDAARPSSRPGDSAMVYLEVAATPGNGKIYEILSVKKGEPPEGDADLQALAQSFTFLQPPRLAWYQHLLHESSNLFGMPLLLAALGMGIYLLTIRHRTDILTAQKIKLTSTAACLAMINAFWIAGFNCAVGIVSALLLGALLLILQPLVREQRGLIAEGKAIGPTPRQLKMRFWLLAVSSLLGIVMADVSFGVAGLSIPFILLVDVFTLGMVGLILWSQRRRFFPKTDTSTEPKPSPE